MSRMNTLFNDHLKGDRTIWVVALLLGVTSLLAVYSASSWMGWRHDGGTFRILVKHGLMLAAGGGIMYAASKLRFTVYRSEEHTSELQSRENLVCRLLLEKKK